MDDLKIKALVAKKLALEQACERKNWIWGKTLKEHIELEKVEVKLRELNYDFFQN